jgi:undecaprenyl-diphosphatase
LSALEALWLGIVQGLTEFLPVSSSGHLVMLREAFGAERESGLLFEIAVHVATLVAIVIFYRRRIATLVMGGLGGDAESWRYAAKLAIATVPAVLVGLFGKELVEEQFENPAVTGVCLLITGALLWTTRHTLARASADEPGWGAALLIGCAQAFAILPGISRSGTTVVVALALGLKAEKAAEFSFLMGVIAIAGAAVLLHADADGASAELLVSIGIGSAAALISGIAAIWLFIRMLRARAFHVFSYYTWAAGALFLGWLMIRAG